MVLKAVATVCKGLLLTLGYVKKEANLAHDSSDFVWLPFTTIERHLRRHVKNGELLILKLDRFYGESRHVN